jgi:hypothetical protein
LKAKQKDKFIPLSQSLAKDSEKRGNWAEVCFLILNVNFEEKYDFLP